MALINLPNFGCTETHAMMKKFILLNSLLFLFLNQFVEAQEQFSVQIEPFTINAAPSLHSFAWAKTTDGKWIVIGGRIDGLHQRQPFAAFLETSNNKDVFLIDPINNQTWSSSLAVLPTSVFEQLQATNQEFHERDNTLYVFGGYGFSITANDHVTFSHLTAISIDELALAIINESDITPYFRQITDANFAVTGGQMDYIDPTFYLCGGQYFEGAYNPMGPDNGPGFIQSYSDEIRKFELIDDGTNLEVSNYTAVNDGVNLHRRDFNMAAQIFPNGERGMTMFSGVFQIDADLPFLNTVDVVPSGYNVNNDFNQYLSQYHSAKIPIYDEANATMHTLFFGGMSQYTLDTDGNLVQDDNVPFVKTISKVTRFSDGTMVESKLNIDMPTLLGSGSEFIPVSNELYYLDNHIVNLNNLPQENILIGYIYGGIDSTAENIFFVNDGTQSTASSQLFKVFIDKSVLGVHEMIIGGDNIFNLKIFPNPSSAIFNLEFFIPTSKKHFIEVHDMLGKKIKSIAFEKEIGKYTFPLDLTDFATGEYTVTLKSNVYFSKKKIIKI